MSVEKVPRSWRLRSFWQKFPRTLLVVLTLLLLPTVVQELVMAWDWYAIHAAARRLERWGDEGEPPHGVQVAVALEPRLWVRLARAGWGLRDALHDWCPSLVDTPHVISITLVGPRYDDAALEFATNTFPQVRQLRLEGCAVSPAGLRMLRAWVQLKGLQLEQISLSGDALEVLAGVPWLKTLEIRDCPTLGEVALRQFPPLPHLESLQLETWGVEAAGLRGLDELPALTKLSLHDDQLTDEFLRALPMFPALKLLSIRSSQLTGRCLAHLGQLPALTVLEIDGSPIDDAGLDCLPVNNRLRGLFLVGTRVTGPGLTALERLPALDDLSLAQAPLTDDGLAFLPQLPKLQALNLSEAALTAKSFPLLRQRCPQSKTLLVTLSETLTRDDIAQWQKRGEGNWSFHTGWKSAREVERQQSPLEWYSTESNGSVSKTPAQP